MEQPKPHVCHACSRPLAGSGLLSPDDGHFEMVPLTRGKYALVDEADAEWIMRMGNWYAAGRGDACYAARGGGRSPVVLMHQLIIGFKAPDHANRNGLDNRRTNLRPATGMQQHANQGLRSNNTSGYRGVTLNRPTGRWCAYIRAEGRTTYLGYFDNPIDAAYAYNQAALELFGEFAWLNPIPDGWVPKGRPPRRPPRNAPPRSDNTSGYRGVHWSKQQRKWMAMIKADGKRRYLGSFADPAEAARAYNAAAWEAWGEYAYLNPIPDVTEPPAA